MRFAYLSYGALVIAGFLFGLMYAGLLGESWRHRIGLSDLLLIGLSFFVVGILGFLRLTRIPFRALLDIDAERRASPEGACSAQNLRSEFEFLVAASAVLVACAFGQFIRLWSGYPVETASLFLAAAVGCSLATTWLWFRLKLGALRT
jgi:hypothetical protein